MTQDDYAAAIMSCVMAARLLSLHDLPGILAAIERTEALGPLLDPTLYRDRSRAMWDDKEMLEAAMPLWRLAERLKEKRA